MHDRRHRHHSLGAIINNAEIAYVVGAVFAIVLVIGIGIYLYNAGND